MINMYRRESQVTRISNRSGPVRSDARTYNHATEALFASWALGSYI